MNSSRKPRSSRGSIWRKPMPRRLLIFLPLAALLITAAVDDTTQRLVRGFDLIGSVYRQVLSEYVDQVSPDDLLTAGVNGMLKSLDPYAEFIEKRENSEVDALSRGSYGGLGIKVRNQDGHQYISYIYDQVRELTNMRVGDEILRIDGVSLAEEGITDLRPLLRGTPGSTVALVVRRPGISDSLDLVVRRRSVTLDPLPCTARFEDDILYLKINRFTRSSADSVRNVLRRSFAAHDIKGVIIDVRNNPGGLLEAAVALVDQFVHPGNLVVSMRGRQAGYARNYPSREEAVDADVPLAVLVNGRSASASEIVAGALQDLDRAVIIGQRTFGKGLVQTLVPLSHGATLKLTTSRYYIPSGRCIQRLAYENGKGVAVVPDTVEKHFRTLRLSRPMPESLGIVPDVTLPADSLPPVLRSLQREYAVFHFVARYNNIFSPTTPPEISDEMREAFRAFADSLALLGEDPLISAERSLAEEARRYGVEDAAMEHLSAFREHVLNMEATRLLENWPAVRKELELEFTEQLGGESARIRRELDDDDAVRTARRLLADPEAFEAALLHAGDH
ncbi:S41 family peptidase [bacterium]|nr:S41 family peptidase [bacterium]